MQTKLAPKKQRQRFVRKVQRHLHLLGADYDCDEFTLETTVGKLTLTVRENQAEGLGAILGRFQYPNLARTLVDCSPYSGKWNHYYFSDWTVETAFKDFVSKVQALLLD